MEPTIKTFNNFDKDHVMIKWMMIIVIVVCLSSVGYGYYYMINQIELANQRVIVVDGNNQTYIGERDLLTRERRQGQLMRHVEIFWELFWNVDDDLELMEKSVNKALELIDDSGLRLYEKYYEVQNMGNFLYENNGISRVSIENIQIDMSAYPYKGIIESTHEIETNFGSSVRRMDATFEIIRNSNSESYKNPVGAKIKNLKIVNDNPVEDE